MHVRGCTNTCFRVQYLHATLRTYALSHILESHLKFALRCSVVRDADFSKFAKALKTDISCSSKTLQVDDIQRFLYEYYETLPRNLLFCRDQSAFYA